MTEEVWHTPDSYRGGKGEGGNIRKRERGSCYRQEVKVHMMPSGIGPRESQNLKPRKLILKTHDSFSRKFASPKITRYTVGTNGGE